MVLRPNSSAIRPSLLPHQITQSSSSGSTKAAPAPLSWKDAVKNGVSAPPPQQQQQQAAPSPHKPDARARHDPKPPRQTTCQRAKLLRSRVAARIADAPAFRRRNNSAPSQPTNSSSSTTSGRVDSAETMVSDGAKWPLLKGSGPVQQNPNPNAGARQQNASDAAAARTTAGLASPRQTAAAARATATDDARLSRERSASADLVLLRRSDLPRWLLTKKTTTTTTPLAGDTSRTSLNECTDASPSVRVMRSRAMSVSDPKMRADDARRIRDASSSAAEDDAACVKTPCVLESGDDGELSELDCDDTNSESTAESSCPSPRHSPVSGFGRHALAHPSLPLHALGAPLEDHESLADALSTEDEQDLEAMLLLDRINDLSAEFLAHREYEEATALSWSVEHAARQGVISHDMAQNLHASVQHGAIDEVRDVLYHKCHLVPAVGSVVEGPGVAALRPAVAQAFLSYVDALAPTDAPPARAHKLHVLQQLSAILTRWVKAVAHERGLSEEHVAITRGALFLAGSYRLGLHDPASDIDAVCVVPYHVTHEDFFGSFAAMLAHAEGVTHLAPVPHAYVPLISLSFLGVSLDLLFARLPMACVDAHQEIDSDHMLVGVHAPSMKSLNAPRVSAMLLCLVPKRRVFRVVLRAVRTWARRRGIYSAKLGYLGGISWAILVAFVCQMYPDAEPAKVFLRFFQVMSEWQWPQPVMLNVIYDASLGFEMWDPRQNLYDRSHIMPIITPAYPHMNSAVQVSQSTFSVIYEEIWRARYLAEAAAGVPSASLLGDANAFSTVGLEASFVPPATASVCVAPDDAAAAAAATVSCPWEKLFEPSNFFIRYDTYLVADFQAATPSEMHQWGKFVASRLRKLVDSVQHVSLVSRVHALPSYFPHTSGGAAPGSCMFIGIEFHARRSSNNSSSNSSASASLLAKDDPEVKRNVEQTIRFFLATDLQQFEYKQPSMTAAARLLSWDELPAFVFPSGRAAAVAERVAYHANLEAMGFAQSAPSFRPSYYATSYARNGRWRGGGPRKYNGGGKGKLNRLRDGARAYPVTQAG
ncbi:hypothetical protein PybrP1_001613 [[Pythium] brassicae (nom. inval.)]|nr:hypothetical protein PybrP1_001613 [[Pythium] brassicae (nom. inval.)]